MYVVLLLWAKRYYECMELEQEFMGKVVTKAIIEYGGKVLVVRDHEDDAVWELPGGHININENTKQAIEREIKEELGVAIVAGQLIYSEQIIHKGNGLPHLFLMFAATLTNPSQPFMVPSKEIAEVKWIDKKSIKELRVYEECERALEAFWKI